MSTNPAGSPLQPSAAVPPLNLYQLIDQDSDPWTEARRYLQGNITKGHGRKHSAVIPIQITEDKAKSRKGLAELALGYVVSAEQQDERETARWFRNGRRTREYVDTEVFGFLYLSVWGYRKLGYTDAELTKAFADPEGGENWFLTGMEKHDMIPSASPEAWESAYKNQYVDALLLLSCDHPDVLNTAIDNAKAQLSSFAKPLGIERGEVKRNEEGHRIEPFGFRDDISRPDVLVPNPAGPKPPSDSPPIPVLPVHLLVQDPLAKNQHAFGSYLVYCKLEQDVDGFNRDLENLANAMGVSADQAGAMIIGRFKDGTPLSNENKPVGRRAPDVPNFVGSDLGGLKCPFYAHIRKVNPRVNRQGTTVANPLFRRGVPYHSGSERLNGSESKPSLGLLFFAFVANIGTQFGSMMAAWVNRHDFPVENTGTDALMGTSSGPQTWPSANGSTSSAFGRHVTLRGGELFFAPSLAFFQQFL